MKYTALGFIPAFALGATGATGVQADEPNDWTGAYLGANFGIAILDGDVRIVAPAGTNTPNLSDTGVTFGGTLGYNWQHGDWVFGVEGDFNFVDVNDDFGFFTGKGTGALRADHDWFATLRGRAGFDMNDTLFYATGGIAFLDSTLRLSGTTMAGFVSETDTEVLVGYALGAGIEHRFSANWSAKAEYLYMNFETQSTSVSSLSARIEPELHVVRAGINYHFCTGGPC